MASQIPRFTKINPHKGIICNLLRTMEHSLHKASACKLDKKINSSISNIDRLSKVTNKSSRHSSTRNLISLLRRRRIPEQHTQIELRFSSRCKEMISPRTRRIRLGACKEAIHSSILVVTKLNSRSSSSLWVCKEACKALDHRTYLLSLPSNNRLQ